MIAVTVKLCDEHKLKTFWIHRWQYLSIEGLSRETRRDLFAERWGPRISWLRKCRKRLKQKKKRNIQYFTTPKNGGIITHLSLGWIWFETFIKNHCEVQVPWCVDMLLYRLLKFTHLWVEHFWRGRMWGRRCQLLQTISRVLKTVKQGLTNCSYTAGLKFGAMN